MTTTIKRAQGQSGAALEAIAERDQGALKIIDRIIDVLAAGNLYSGPNLAWLGAQLLERRVTGRPGVFMPFGDVIRNNYQLRAGEAAFHIMRPRGKKLETERPAWDSAPVFCEAQMIHAARLEQDALKLRAWAETRDLGRANLLDIPYEKRWLKDVPYLERPIFAAVIIRTFGHDLEGLTVDRIGIPSRWNSQARVKDGLGALSQATRAFRSKIGLDA